MSSFIRRSGCTSLGRFVEVFFFASDNGGGGGGGGG